MSFMDNLMSNPSGSIYKSGSNKSDDFNPLEIVNQLKDREMRDYMAKANFSADLEARQGVRMRSLMDPQKITEVNPSKGDGQGMNTVMARDPNAMTDYQKGELGVRQEANNLDSQRMAQTGKLGQQALDIKDSQQKLNQEKSDQINTLKQADMERRIADSAAKIEMAQKVLESRDSNAAAQLEAHKALAAAAEERHKAELENRQHQFDVTSEQHAAQIKALQDRLDQNANSETTTEINADGTKKTVKTKKGSMINVVGKDGKTYPIPADKLDDWNANHAGEAP